MKRIALIFPLFFCLTTHAVDRVTITLTITNNPSAGNTFVPNASTRTWRSSVTTPSTEILIGANIGASATNLFRQLSSYKLSGPVDLGFNSSNIITIKGIAGQAMAATMSGTWGTVSYSTNQIGPMNEIRVPMTREPTQSTATNNASLLASNLGTYSTNGLAAGTTLVGNLVQTSGNQDIAGTKNFTYDPYISNSVPSLTLWDTSGGTDEKVAILSQGAGQFSLSFADDALGSFANVFYVVRSGVTPISMTLVPPLAATTILDCTLTNAAITNSYIGGSTLRGTNYSSGIFGHTRANNTTLANGPNSGLDFGAKVYVKIKAGPTGAFSICGITGGADGRVLILHNSVAFNKTIANESGSEPVPANRITTLTGGDVPTTTLAAATLIYDSEDSRWILISIRD